MALFKLYFRLSSVLPSLLIEYKNTAVRMALLILYFRLSSVLPLYKNTAVNVRMIAARQDFSALHAWWCVTLLIILEFWNCRAA
jgi:hypothetical protein